MQNQTDLSNAVTLALGNIPNREDEAVQVLESLPDTVEGLMDLGYKFAKVRASASALALKASEMIPGFPENVADEHKAKVVEGYRLHKAELMGEKWYKRDGFDADKGDPNLGRVNLELVKVFVAWLTFEVNAHISQ